MEVREGHNIECTDWILVGDPYDEGFQLMVPMYYRVDVLDEYIMILN